MLLAFVFPADAAPRTKTNSTQTATPGSAPAPLTTPEKRTDPPIDTTAVRRYYMEGDFDPAVDILETALRYKTGFSKADSIFIFKHLGVMCVAKYETREKGKKYMLRLLEVEPTARILDMYASDMIYMIFKNIKDEFDASQQYLVGSDTTLIGGRRTGPGVGREKRESSRKETSPAYLWLGATAALAIAGGAATYFYFSDEQKIDAQDHQPD